MPSGPSPSSPQPAPTAGEAWASWYRQLAAAQGRLRQRRLRRARELIDRCYELPLDVERLAAEACFSPFHFLREFRRAYGETPHRYLTLRRVARARELLTTTDLPVTEICWAVGFRSLGSFSTLFRRYAGHSPHRYRARIIQVGALELRRPELAIPFCFADRFGLSRPAV